MIIELQRARLTEFLFSVHTEERSNNGMGSIVRQ